MTRLTNILLCSLLISGLTTSVTAETTQNVNPNVHPDIAEAQRLINLANQQIHVAERANQHDLGGHAGRASMLLHQAADELKQAQLVVDNGVPCPPGTHHSSTGLSCFSNY